MAKRYIVVGPSQVQGNVKKPGLYSVMQFKPGGYGAPPLPLLIQCPDDAVAQVIYDRLQPFFTFHENWSSVPRTMVAKFTSTQEFQCVAELVENRRQLIWAVKLGSKAGLFLDTVEAIASVDHSKRNDFGEIFQEAFAFRSFTEAVRCQMLNDRPRTHIHVYNPANEPERSAALRRTLLEEGIKDEPLDPDLGISGPVPDPDSPQLPPNRGIPSAPSTPRRQHSTPSTQPALSWGNVLFAPNINVRVTSPGPASTASPGPLTPTRVARAPRGRELGHRLLIADGLSLHDASDFEDMLLTAQSSAGFVDEVRASGGLLGALNAEKVAVLWDLSVDTR
ncbi:hypothetical protein BDP27DRAFT_1433669 [Rhodocollybia butyracea]|uniref:Uncharacterized protein n=1 Tax=Rhodocollybia butyracea TaxID=206335 RepID=A0A9P5P7A4_9AGAR|nr:hypothetical protein BDP27DRAFT_1433669 [Rhodocollybia butyracea]